MKQLESGLVSKKLSINASTLLTQIQKEQSALIVFGFSFYDEHISDVVQRSLNNPNLIVLIFCFQNDDAADIISRFNFSDFTIPKNIIFIKPDDFLKKTYSSEVHSIVINSNKIPVLDFYSLNSCMEEELSNKYLPIMLETGDIYE